MGGLSPGRSHHAGRGARIEALEQLNRDTRLLVLDQAWWCANPLGMLWTDSGVNRGNQRVVRLRTATSRSMSRSGA